MSDPLRGLQAVWVALLAGVVTYTLTAFGLPVMRHGFSPAVPQPPT